MSLMKGNINQNNKGRIQKKIKTLIKEWNWK